MGQETILGQPDNEFAIKFAKFSQMVVDLEQDDQTLQRFLRARQWDLGKAEEMLRKCVQWREQIKVDSLKAPPARLAELFPYKYLGYDNEGHVVVFVPLGRWDFIGGFQEGWKDEMYKLKTYILEQILMRVRKSSKDKFVFVLDIWQGPYKTVVHYESVQLILTAFREFESFYPETMHAAYVIRTPWAFPIMWAMVKPLLSGDTLSKVKILAGDDEPSWKPTLLETITSDVLQGMY